MSVACDKRRKSKKPYCEGKDNRCKWVVGRGCKDKMPSRYIKYDSNIQDTPEKTKFCRCALHVMASGSSVNPYAVCAASVTTTTGGKSCDYNWDYIPFSEVKAYSLFHAHKLNLSATQIHEMSETELRTVLTEWYEKKKNKKKSTKITKSK